MDGSVQFMNDIERLCMARQWADDAYAWLAEALDSGLIKARDPDVAEQLAVHCDGLVAFADVLHTLTRPYPAPGRHLRVVK